MCREAETCCFEDLVTRVFELEGGGYEEGYEEEGRWEVAIRYTTPSWMRTCLRSVKYSGSKATATATIIKNILRETYAFSDLVRDTHDTDSFVSGRYAGNFNVHHLRVPISASVDKVLQDSKLEGGHHHSAYDFHYGVAEIFHSLNDAHTSYETPFGDFALHRAVTLWPQLESNNKQVFVLKSLLDDFSAEVAGIYRDVHGVEMPDISLYKGQVVTHVNGVPAAEYMQQRADAFGGIKSQGGRLNNLLNMESSYGGDIEPLGDHPPPEVDEEVFRFEDGTEVTWKLTISYEGGAEVESHFLMTPTDTDDT